MLCRHRVTDDGPNQYALLSKPLTKGSIDGMQFLTIKGDRGCSWPLLSKHTDRGVKEAAPAMYADALDVSFEDDRYLVAYHVPGWTPEQQRRLRKESLLEIQNQGVTVECPWAILDIDYKDQDLTPEWRQQNRTFWDSLPDWFAIYDTPHGYRVIYQLDAPVAPDVLETVQAALAARLVPYSVPVDVKCTTDWQRLYRAPWARYKDTGKNTWEFCDPAPVKREGTVLVVATLDLIQTRPTYAHAAANHEHEFGGRGCPDREIFLDEISGSRTGRFSKDSGAGVLLRGAIGAAKAQANSPVSSEQEHGNRILEPLEILRDHLPFINERNNTINGAALMLSNKVKGKQLIPEDVFAAMAPSLDAMDKSPKCPAPDASERAGTWYEHGWEVCCEMASKVNAERLERAKTGEANAGQAPATPEELDYRKKMIGRFLKSNPSFPAEVLPPEWMTNDDDLIVAWKDMREWAFLTNGSKTWILNNEGKYTPSATGKDYVHQALRRLGNPYQVPLESYNPETMVSVSKTAKKVIESAGSGIETVSYKFNDATEPETEARFTKGRQDTITTELVVSSSWWRPEVHDRPRFDPQVHEFLYYLAGCDDQAFGGLIAWLAHFQDQSKSLPMLIFSGQSRVGKSLLISGLEDMFCESSRSPSLLSELGVGGTGQRQGGDRPQANPLLLADEGIIAECPESINGGTVAQTVRKSRHIFARAKEMITSSRQRGKVLYNQGNSMTYMRPRLVVSDNDEMDVKAMLRVTDDDATEGARASLINRVYAVNPGRDAFRWIHDPAIQSEIMSGYWAVTDHPYKGGDGFAETVKQCESAYAIARHIRFLNVHRDEGMPTRIGQWQSMDQFRASQEGRLFSIVPNSYMMAQVEEGSQLKAAFMDEMVAKLRRSFTDDIQMEPTQETAIGIYFCYESKSFVAKTDTMMSLLDGEAMRLQMNDRKKSMCLHRWGVNKLKKVGDGDKGRINLLWRGAWTEFPGRPFRSFPARELLQYLYATNNESMLMILEREGIIALCK